MSRSERAQIRAAKRRALIRRSMLSLATLGLLAVCWHSVGFSGANFVDSSSNPSNLFIAGTLSHSNPRDGEVILSASKLRPGGSRSTSITIVGGGDLTGTYVLLPGSLSASPTLLAGALQLQITNTTTGAQLYAGSVSAFGSTSSFTVAPGESHTLAFTLSYPAQAADAQLQGGSMTLAIQIVGETR
ncbi:MAG: hypothetical protein R2826_03110 [Thermoleophilia bacterium]